jgi:serine/threonine-protein kinase
MPLDTGAQLGSFEILGALGAGGMGEVYAARDNKLGRKVALKILPAAFAREADRLARFEREARVLAALNHPNIATLHGLDRAGDQSFLVMELVEGDTLADRIARGPLPVEDVVAIARQIVDALEAAHAKGIVHRDLKPANVKITPEGKVKVLDFGLAKGVARSESSQDLLSSPTMTAGATYAGAILGTAPYMAPEQAKGHEVDQRADVFSFGCVLFELLTGRRSFPGATVTEAIASVLAREADLTLLPPHIHSGLRTLLVRCLEKDPARRWQSIGDVRLELEAIALDPRGARTPVVTAQPPSRRPIVIAVAATAVVAVAATALVLWMLRPTPAAPQPVHFAHVLPGDQSFTRTGRHVLGISPDGTTVAYVANNQVYLRTASDLTAHPIPGSNQDVNTPVFSPDGRWIAFCAVNEGRLKKMPIAGGGTVVLAGIENPTGMDWYADDAMLVGQGTRGIARVSTSGGSKPEIVITVKPGEFAQSPRMLPDGHTVLFTVAKAAASTDWDTAQIVVQSLNSTERKVLRDGGSDAWFVPTGHLLYAVSTTVFAVPFDVSKLAVTGGPVPILEDIARASCCTGAALFVVSKNGTLATVPGHVSSQRVLAVAQRSGERRVLDLPAASYDSFDLARDGHQIAITVSDKDATNAWVGDFTGKGPLRLLTFGGNNNFSPIWTLDSKRIVFHSDRDHAGDFSVYWQAGDGSGSAERLTTAAEGEVHQAESWAPDGHVLALTVSSPTLSYIATLDVTGDRKLRSLIQQPGKSAWSPRFSPDGHWLAYVTDESTTPQIYVQPYPPTGAKYRVSPNGGDDPRWAPDGSQLYFLGSVLPGSAAGFGTKRLMSVETRMQSAFTYGSPVPLPIDGISSHYGLTADGRQFVLNLAMSEASSVEKTTLQIHVVLNWFEELKAKMDGK